MAIVKKARWIEKIPMVGGAMKGMRVAGNVMRVGGIAVAGYAAYKMVKKFLFKNAEQKVAKKELDNRKIEANIRAKQLEQMSRAA